MIKLLEILGFISGILGVWLTMKKNIWCFPVGLINVIISLYLFSLQALYADSLQQAVYILLLIYGWIRWNHTSDKNQYIPITSLNRKSISILVIVVSVSTILLATILANFTNAQLPWLDSFATSCAFIAQYLIARKKIETWILWMLVNFIYIGIYLNNELYLYVVLFTLYGILSVLGWNSWKMELKTQYANAS
ncbi:MAG: nicotinamide mononucleotide transporter [Bacteroidetes bacterium]|nr:nicotinamide mononucleotide transporter [Bacteroidota bacterium]